MKLNFKRAAEKDTAIIAKLAESIWKKHYISIISMEQIEYMLKSMYSVEGLLKQMNEGHQFTLVYAGERPAGYISISTKDNKDYFLHKFYVETEDQRKGTGSALLNHVLKEIPQVQTIELTVNRQNYKAINFYFKNGFIIKEVADFDIGNGYFMNDFVMIKSLQ